jgi:hypothetical protein
MSNADLPKGINQSGLMKLPSLRFESPIKSGTVGAINGKNTLNQANISASINGIYWANGDYMVIRFDDSTINSHGLAIDNFTFEADTVISLPILLKSFKGIKTGVNIFLDWSTSNEQRIKEFQVERSYSSFSSYNKIGSILAKDKQSNLYEFIDNPIVNSSSIYYRLKIINQNGTFSYSNTILINQSMDNNKITITPNPVTNLMVVHKPDSNKTTIEIINIAGKLIKEIK